MFRNKIDEASNDRDQQQPSASHATLFSNINGPIPHNIGATLSICSRMLKSWMQAKPQVVPAERMMGRKFVYEIPAPDGKCLRLVLTSDEALRGAAIFRESRYVHIINNENKLVAVEWPPVRRYLLINGYKLQEVVDPKCPVRKLGVIYIEKSGVGLKYQVIGLGWEHDLHKGFIDGRFLPAHIDAPENKQKILEIILEHASKQGHTLPSVRGEFTSAPFFLEEVAEQIIHPAFSILLPGTKTRLSYNAQTGIVAITDEHFLSYYNPEIHGPRSTVPNATDPHVAALIYMLLQDTFNGSLSTIMPSFTCKHYELADGIEAAAITVTGVDISELINLLVAASEKHRGRVIPHDNQANHTPTLK